MKNKLLIPVVLLSTGCLILGGLFLLTTFHSDEPVYRSLKTVKELDAVLAEKPTPYLMIDIRDKKHYNEGHIPGFVNFPPHDNGEKLLAYLGPFDKNKPILLICYGGNRSARTFELLAVNGFRNLTDFTPGYNQYVRQKGEDFLPEKGDCGCEN